jgi:hypothetical protein
LGLCLIYSLLVAAKLHAQQPAVLVEVNGQYQGYFERPRLQTVLAPLATDASRYWPSARLYRLEPHKQVVAERLRTKISEQLRQLTIHWKDRKDIAAALMELNSQLQRWRLAEPVFIPLDPDAVRVNPALDPKLDTGSYLLQVKSRPNHLTFVGLGGDQYIQHQSNLALYRYIPQLTQHRWTDTEKVYWLTNSPSPVSIPVASWNRNEQPLPPGSYLFVPLPAWILIEPAQNLNQQLLELLQYRITK